ncbi:MAG: hypothetical protein P8Y45_12685, partial [Exilibacterium sp.]
GLVARFGMDSATDAHSAAETHGATEPAKRGWHLLFRSDGPSLARSRAIPGACRSKTVTQVASTGTAVFSSLSLQNRY